MIDPSVINQLIQIGRSGDSSDAHAARLLALVKPHDEIGRLHWHDWDAATEAMTTNDLVFLVKGLTLAELINEWCGGSVSSVIWTFRAVERRDPVLSDRLADWILPRTRNSSVPFGFENHGAKSVAEYRECQSAHAIHRAARQGQIAEEEKRAAGEREVRAQQRRSSARDRNAPTRNTLLQQLLGLTLEDQLRRLAADRQYSVEFYPTSIANKATGEVLAGLDVNTRMALLVKLKGRRRGPWNRFKARLLKIA